MLINGKKQYLQTPFDNENEIEQVVTDNAVAPGQAWSVGIDGITTMLETRFGVQWVRIPSGKGLPPTGSESCQCRETEAGSVDSEC